MIRNRIDPNLENLDELNDKYQWVPGRENIRPCEEVINKKDKWIENLSNFYENEKQYVLSDIFNFDSYFDSGKLVVKDFDIKETFVFKENMFPYNLPFNTNHYVIWYTYDETDEKRINKDIELSLFNLLGNNKFDFVWYENPKKSLPDMNHYQVFWISLNL